MRLRPGAELLDELTSLRVAGVGVAVAVARDAPGEGTSVVVVEAGEAHLAKLALVPSGALAPARQVVFINPVSLFFEYRGLEFISSCAENDSSKKT